MVAKKSRKPSKKVKSLPAKNVNAKQARGIKGGDVRVSEIVVTKGIDVSTTKLSP
jgi:hypothetical protein